MTHYIPAFTRKNRHDEWQAACGTFVKTIRHSCEPTCVACKAYLEGEAATDKAMEAMAAEPFDPSKAVKAVEPISTLAGYRPRGAR